MATSKASEVQPCSSKEQEPQEASSKPTTLTHNIPIPQNLDKSKLDWLLQINEQFFEAELRTVVSTFPILDLLYIFTPLFSTIHSILNSSILPLQGFSIQNLTPNEAAAVLFRAEERMGKAIPEEDLKAGNLKQHLLPEDYQPIKQVSTLFIYLFLGSLLAEVSGGFSGPGSVMSRLFDKILKNTSSLDEDFQPTDQFLQVTAYWCPLYLPRVFTHYFPA